MTINTRITHRKSLFVVFVCFLSLFWLFYCSFSSVSHRPLLPLTIQLASHFVSLQNSKWNFRIKRKWSVWPYFPIRMHVRDNKTASVRQFSYDADKIIWSVALFTFSLDKTIHNNSPMNANACIRRALKHVLSQKINLPSSSNFFIVTFINKRRGKMNHSGGWTTHSDNVSFYVKFNSTLLIFISCVQHSSSFFFSCWC